MQHFRKNIYQCIIGNAKSKINDFNYKYIRNTSLVM